MQNKRATKFYKEQLLPSQLKVYKRKFKTK